MIFIGCERLETDELRLDRTVALAALAAGKSTDQSMRYNGTLDALRRIVRDEAGAVVSIHTRHTPFALQLKRCLPSGGEVNTTCFLTGER